MGDPVRALHNVLEGFGNASWRDENLSDYADVPKVIKRLVKPLTKTQLNKLFKLKVNVSKINRWEMYPIHAAAYCSLPESEEIFSILLQKGAAVKVDYGGLTVHEALVEYARKDTPKKVYTKKLKILGEYRLS